MKKPRWTRLRKFCRWCLKKYQSVSNEEKRQFWLGVLQDVVSAGIVALIGAVLTAFLS